MTLEVGFILPILKPPACFVVTLSHRYLVLCVLIIIYACYDWVPGLSCRIHWPNIYCPTTHQTGETALTCAASKGFVECARVLVEAGAVLDTTINVRETIVIVAYQGLFARSFQSLFGELVFMFHVWPAVMETSNITRQTETFQSTLTLCMFCDVPWFVGVSARGNYRKETQH